MSEELIPRCPYCGKEMNKWSNPEETNWGSPYLYICFNDECEYFVKGWSWMLENYKVKASYRHRIDPATGSKGPIAVWSFSALKSGIIK